MPGPGPGALDVKITAPVDGATVDPGFQVSATASGAAVVGLFIDGTLLRTATAAPYVFPTPTSLAFGTPAAVPYRGRVLWRTRVQCKGHSLVRRSYKSWGIAENPCGYKWHMYCTQVAEVTGRI